MQLLKINKPNKQPISTMSCIQSHYQNRKKKNFIYVLHEIHLNKDNKSKNIIRKRKHKTHNRSILKYLVLY